MNAIKRTYIKLKKKALRLYDWHYMIRVYAKAGNNWGDFGLPLVLGDLIWFLFFANLVNPLWLGTQMVHQNTFMIEYALCAAPVPIFSGVFDYKIYMKGKREEMLNKVWQKKSRKTNIILFFLEFSILILLGMVIFVLLCSQYTYK